MSSPIPFFAIRLLITTVVILLTAAGFSMWALGTRSTEPYHYLVPVLLFIALCGIKLAAPNVPWGELVAAILIVLLIHFGSEHYVPALLIAEKFIEVVCVLAPR